MANVLDTIREVQTLLNVLVSEKTEADKPSASVDEKEAASSEVPKPKTDASKKTEETMQKVITLINTPQRYGTLFKINLIDAVLYYASNNKAIGDAFLSMLSTLAKVGQVELALEFLQKRDSISTYNFGMIIVYNKSTYPAQEKDYLALLEEFATSGYGSAVIQLLSVEDIFGYNFGVCLQVNDNLIRYITLLEYLTITDHHAAVAELLAYARRGLGCWLSYKGDSSVIKHYFDLLNKLQVRVGPLNVMKMLDKSPGDNWHTGNKLAWKLNKQQVSSEFIVDYLDLIQTCLLDARVPAASRYHYAARLLSYDFASILVASTNEHALLRQFFELLNELVSGGCHAKVKEILSKRLEVVSGYGKQARLIIYGSAAANMGTREIDCIREYLAFLQKLDVKDQVELFNLEEFSFDGAYTSFWTRVYRNHPNATINLLLPYIEDERYVKMDLSSLIKSEHGKEFKAKVFEAIQPKERSYEQRVYSAFCALRKEDSLLYQIFHAKRNIVKAPSEDDPSSFLYALKEVVKTALGDEQSRHLLSLSAAEAKALSFENFSEKFTISVAAKIVDSAEIVAAPPFESGMGLRLN